MPADNQHAGLILRNTVLATAPGRPRSLGKGPGRLACGGSVTHDETGAKVRTPYPCARYSPALATEPYGPYCSFPDLTSLRKSRHASALNRRIGPVGSFESRTAVPLGRGAISTQSSADAEYEDLRQFISTLQAPLLYLIKAHGARQSGRAY